MTLPPPSPADRAPQHVTEVSQGTGADPTVAFPAPDFPVPDPPAPDPDAADTAAYDFRPPAPLATLDARDVTAWFGDHMVLDQVSLTMQAGQVTSLIGPSGCGKSTFLRILNRMHQMIPGAAMAGEVLLDGVDIYDPRIRLTEARRDIGMVFQKPNPFPAMSIYDNVIAGLKLTGTRLSRGRAGRARRGVPDQGRAVAGGPRTGCGSPAARCPAGSSSGCASPARWRSGRGCC